MTVKVLNNQSLLDLAIQATGNVENAFLIAKENSLAVDSYLVPGYDLIIPYGVAFNRDILDFYDAKKLKPGTKLNDDAIEMQQSGGIGFWIIDETFEVQ